MLASTTQMPKSIDPKVKLLADNVMESKGPWVLYEMMPTDEHEAFANLPEDQKKWSGESKDGQNEFRQGRPAGRRRQEIRTAAPRLPGDFPGLRDASHAVRRPLGIGPSGLELPGGREQGSEEPGGRGGKRKDPGRRTNSSGPKPNGRQWRISLPPGRTCSASIQAAVQEAIAKNLNYAQEIARLQKEAADLIDRRTRSMAQFGPRAN